MKKTKMIIGLAVSLMAFMLIAPVFASPITSTLTISNNGKIWRAPSYPYNGGDVVGAKAVYFLSTDLVNPAGELIWTRMQKYVDGVTLYFDPNNIKQVLQGLPDGVTVEQTTVYLTIYDVQDPLTVSGPGFAWGRIR